MMRSLFSGVSGLKSHQTRMDVIGNNIANVNTTGYKSKQLNFSDMLYQTTQAASGPSTNVGGINPRQIGLGVKTAAINTTITQEGATQSTGNPFDLKLTGEAFFIVSDGTNTYYTRDGSFDVDKAGNLCMASTGYIVQGYRANDDGEIIDGAVGSLNVMAKNTYGAAATTSASVSGIIDATDETLQTKNGKIMNLQVLDNKGYQYNLQFGILPQTITTNGTRDIHNTENEFTLSTPLYKVDTSKLTYNYTVGTENRILSSTDSPKLIDALDDAVWNFVGGTPKQGVTVNGTYTFGTATNLTANPAVNDLTIEINDAFLTAYDLDLLQYSNLKGTTIHIAFSGETGYVKSTVAPTYPLDSDTIVNKIDDDAMAIFYTPGTATNGVQEYTIPNTSNNGTVTTIKQDYEDDDGNAITDYIFRDATGATITAAGGTEIPSDLYSEIMKIMNLGQKSEVQNSYITQEPKDTTSVNPGQYTVTLLGMSGDDGPVDISALLNNGTTSWNLSYNKDTGVFDYIGEAGNDSFNLALSSVDTKFSNVEINFSDTINQFNEGKSSITAEKDDGRMQGSMTGVSIANDGIITANYSNGMSLVLGQICVGIFANAMGLQNEGDNLYSETANSGDCQTVDIKASGTGYMTTGVLEMSNVDLSQEFTDMITTQRGFQANSRIITTSDTLLEELVNLKR